MRINYISDSNWNIIEIKFKNALNSKCGKEYRFAKAIEFYCINCNSKNLKAINVPAFETDKISQYLNLEKLKQSLSKLNISITDTQPGLISFKINNDNRQHNPMLENISNYVNY